MPRLKRLQKYSTRRIKNKSEKEVDSQVQYKFKASISLNKVLITIKKLIKWQK